MKHVFFVHTPITFLCSIAIINRLQLKKENAVILFQSFYNVQYLNNDAYESLSIDDFFPNKNYLQKTQNFFTGFNISKKIDRFINTVTGNKKFIAYIPVVSFIHKVLITHNNCVQFNFIEEGLTHYYKEETLESINAMYSKNTWRTSLKNLKQVLSEIYLVARGYNFKLLGLPFSYACYPAIKNIKFYGFSNQSFPLIESERRCILNFDTVNFKAINHTSSINLNNSFIWIGDPGTVHHGYSESMYLSGIENGYIHFLKQKNIQHVLLKFHRDEPTELRKKTQHLFFKNNISVELIQDSVIMELLLANATDVTLTGIYSSLLYYAAVMGHQSFSIFNYVSAEYSKTITNRDFSFFWEKVQLLN